MKKIISILATAALLAMSVLSLASCGTSNYAENNTEFYIGASGPLTGGAAVYGIAVKNSAQMAVDEINAAGGVNGMKLKFVMMDDMHDASKVSTNYTAMFEAGMQASLGCVTSQPCLEFKTLSEADNLFFITPSATADTVPEYDNGYQMCFADGNQGKIAAEYVNSILKGETIGMLYRSDDPYSTGLRQQFLANLDSSIKVVEASFSGDTVASFSSQIGILKTCKFIFMPIYYTPASQFMTEAKNDIASTAVYYGCDGFDGIDTAVEGFDINTIPQEVSYLSHFSAKSTEGASAEYIKKYTALYGSDTLSQFGASAYDCIYAIAAALAKCDNITATSSPSDVCEALKAVFQSDDFVFSGVTGDAITWDANGYVNKIAVKYIVKESSGK